MKGFTMQAVREHKVWSNVELFAYREAAVKYAEAVRAFENTKVVNGKRVSHAGFPSFQAIFRKELASATKAAKRTKAAAVTAAPTT